MRSAIHEAHLGLGAVMVDRDGWELPAHYGDTEAEYWAARKGAVRTDRSHRTKLRVVGDDRVKFLQNILTNDLQSFPPGSGAYAALLTSMGKMVADFRVAALPESILLDAEARCREGAFPNLDKFNLGYDCEISDETDDLGMVTLIGPEGRKTVYRVLGESPGSGGSYECVEFDWNGTKTVAATTDRLGLAAIDLIVPTSSLPSLWEAFEAVPAAGFSALEMLRLEAGVPRFGVDMDESVNPMEAGLLNAIDFDKGCYVGQEVIAKIDSLGHVNRSLVGIRIEGDTPPEEGAALFENGKKVGHVTSTVLSPSLGGFVALGYVHRKSATPGRALEIEFEGQRLPALVAETPFVPESER